MAHRTRTNYPGGQNKQFGLKFQSPEVGRSLEWPKHCECDSEDEDGSLNNVNNSSEIRTVRLYALLPTSLFILVAWNSGVLKLMNYLKVFSAAAWLLKIISCRKLSPKSGSQLKRGLMNKLIEIVLLSSAFNFCSHF